MLITETALGLSIICGMVTDRGRTTTSSNRHDWNEAGLQKGERYRSFQNTTMPLCLKLY